MQKVAFFLNNPTMPDQDYSSILECNPGVGGSEYEFMLIPYLLEQRNNSIEPYLLINFNGKLPHKNIVSISNLDESCKYCIDNSINEIVVDIKSFDKSVLDRYGDNLSVMLWAHNNVSYPLLKLFHKLNYIKKIINCGREELDLYRDNLATLKSTYVYNIFPVKNKEYYLSKINNSESHNVVYMGSIIPAKGFHVLARAWKKVLKKVPDANLYIIGTGKLYNRTAVLGKYNIAEKDYEAYFMKYLTDSDGNLLPSVHFEGLLTEEKYDVLGSCKVGVPNPTGGTECLPITSIEMQLMGCSITTINHAAYLDTVYNHKYLYYRESQLSKYIIKRLFEKGDSYDDLFGYVINKFGVEGNIQRWEYIILNVNKEMLEPVSGYANQMKEFKDVLLRMKCAYPQLIILPPIERFYNFFRYRILKHIDKLFW